jgi:hypothetical protein
MGTAALASVFGAIALSAGATVDAPAGLVSTGACCAAVAGVEFEDGGGKDFCGEVQANMPSIAVSATLLEMAQVGIETNR